jgi:twitching motility protein PilT
MRVNCYKQRGSLASVVRIVPFGIPDYRELGIIEPVMAASDIRQGLVLVSGTAGSGKSTTLACMIDRINHVREGHIITLEDPIEYLYRNDRLHHQPGARCGSIRRTISPRIRSACGRRRT